MQKVLLNLLMNANDAVAEGGEIKVTTGYHDAGHDYLSDTGCGMSKEFMQKRCSSHSRRQRTGMGIGLFHCKTIVEAHGEDE